MSEKKRLTNEEWVEKKRAMGEVMQVCHKSLTSASDDSTWSDVVVERDTAGGMWVFILEPMYARKRVFIPIEQILSVVRDLDEWEEDE